MKEGVRTLLWVLACMVIGFLIVVLFLQIVNPPADAKPGVKGQCPESYITTHEWSLLSVPMPEKKAKQILDGPGKRQPGHPHKRRYEMCGHPNAYDKYAMFWFNHGRLVYGVWVVMTLHEHPGSVQVTQPEDICTDEHGDTYVCGGPLPPPPVCTDGDGNVIDCNFRGNEVRVLSPAGG